jgi:hypothetical protein
MVKAKAKDITEEIEDGIREFLMQCGFCAIRWDGIELLALGSAVKWDDGKPIPTDDSEYYSQEEFEPETSTYAAFGALEDMLCVELPTKDVHVFELIENDLH